MRRAYAYRGRAAWTDDDGQPRGGPLELTAGRLTATSAGDAAAQAASLLEAAHYALNELGVGYPPLDEARVTVDVKAIR